MVAVIYNDYMSTPGVATVDLSGAKDTRIVALDTVRTVAGGSTYLDIFQNLTAAGLCGCAY
jgi:hypothetical protein